MSNVTLLANQYAASADFLQRMNTALLKLKKARFGVRRVGETSAQELRASREELADLVAGVLARLRNQSAGDVVVPEELLDSLRAEYGSRLAWRLPDLKEVVATLRSDAEVGEKELEILDELCQVADATASASFRRLWRR